MNKAELKNKLKPLIEKYLPTLKANNNFSGLTEKSLFFDLDNIGTTVKVQTREEWDLLYSPIEFILSEKDISKNYSEQFIQEKFVELYHKILADDSNLNAYIEELVNDLIGSAKKTFYIFSEIENIRTIDDREYEIIGSTIKIIKKDDLLNKSVQLEQLGVNFIGKPAIFTKVQAGDFDKAIELALYNFKISFNILRLYVPTFKPAIKGYLVQGKQYLIGYDEKEEKSHGQASLVGDPLLNLAYLDNQLYKQLIDAGIGELRKTSTITDVVKDSLYWFGLGLNEEYLSAKLIDFVLVLESALKKESENTELRRLVSERGAILLFVTFEERKNAVKELKDIYDARSKVIHTGTSIEDKDVVSLSRAYASAVLRKLIGMSKNFNGNFDKFIDYLDDTKLRGINDV